MDSFDKGWFVLQTYSGYENKVKENLLQRAQTYNMLENILRVEIPTQTVQVEKNGKTKEIEENRFPGYVWLIAISDNCGSKKALNSAKRSAVLKVLAG